MRPPVARRNRLTIIAQDPGVRDQRDLILTTSVALTPEELDPGPWGHRLQVIDFDTSTDTLYKPLKYEKDENGAAIDPFEHTEPDKLVGDPCFHAQNVYALVMRTLARFEFALGRRVSWGFGGHQLKIVPHAFADANAFYSRADEALLFGYFEAEDGSTIYTCLSHDVIVHETAHALLDGLRGRFIDPSSPDQAAFHEGFADVVALLSVFSLSGVVETILARSNKGGTNLIALADVEPKALKESALLGLAEQMGRELSTARGKALRHSADLDPSPKYMQDPEFVVAHRRGEILVAAVMTAFVGVWSERLTSLSTTSNGFLDLQRVAEEGKDAADYLLTMCIRALDYTPPIHLEFGDYLSAILTADLEIRPDETRFRFREHLRDSFRAYGIEPAVGTHVPSRDGKSVDEETTAVQPPEDGAWVPCRTLALVYDRTHADPLTRDVDEVFRFVWENRIDLKLTSEAFSQVLSVRPSLRVGPDGFVLRETVAEFYQVVRLKPEELREDWQIDLPPGLGDGDMIPLYGGGTLIFDEYGRLKFYIHNSLDNAKRQKPRIDHLLANGILPERAGPATSLTRGSRLSRDFSTIHRLRAFDAGNSREVW